MKTEKIKSRWLLIFPSVYVLTPIFFCFLKGMIDAFFRFTYLFEDSTKIKIYSSCFVEARIASILCIKSRISENFAKEYTDEIIEIDYLKNNIKRTESGLEGAGNVRSVRLQLEKEKMKKKQNELIGHYIIPVRNSAERKIDRILKRYELQVVCYFIGAKFTGRLEGLQPKRNKNLEQLMSNDEYDEFKKMIIPENILNDFPEYL